MNDVTLQKYFDFQIVIEKNIPVPKSGGRGTTGEFKKFKTMVDVMEIGDSFAVPLEYAKRIKHLLTYYNTKEKASGHNRRLARRVYEGNLRVWRAADLESEKL